VNAALGPVGENETNRGPFTLPSSVILILNDAPLMGALTVSVSSPFAGTTKPVDGDGPVPESIVCQLDDEEWSEVSFQVFVSRSWVAFDDCDLSMCERTELSVAGPHPVSSTAPKATATPPVTRRFFTEIADVFIGEPCRATLRVLKP
jgi:hypothetical protein